MIAAKNCKVKFWKPQKDPRKLENDQSTLKDSTSKENSLNVDLFQYYFL